MDTSTRSVRDPRDSRVREQLEVMLALQDGMNELVFADWRERKLAWHRAIYVEAAEFIEHLGAWKWWKKGEADWDQARLELVDIWHFGLAWTLMRSNNMAAAVDKLVYAMGLAARHGFGAATGEQRFEQIHAEVDALVAAAGRGRFEPVSFLNLLTLCELSFEGLFRVYVGKNMLNRLRQRHGYKTGEYRKTWHGEEDNVHLMRVLDAHADVAPSKLADQVMATLEAQYQRVRREPS